MKNSILLLLHLFIFSNIHAQLPDTDIFISEMTIKDGSYSFSPPVNMTRRKGYDNQPCFSAEGTSFYFVAINKDTTQSDIYQCDITTKIIKPFTRTPTSEYSPKITPNGKGLSVVRVDADSGQRFYVIPISNGRVAHHFDHTDSIGYYAWINDSTIAMFVLGDPPTLQVVDLGSGKKKVLASSIGRCLKSTGDGKFLYFVDKSDSSQWKIRRYESENGIISTIVPTLKRSEDFELLKDGTLLTGNDGKLYAYSETSETWVFCADFQKTVNDFYRIVADPSGKRIAIVAFTGEKP